MRVKNEPILTTVPHQQSHQYQCLNHHNESDSLESQDHYHMFDHSPEELSSNSDSDCIKQGNISPGAPLADCPGGDAHPQDYAIDREQVMLGSMSKFPEDKHGEACLKEKRCSDPLECSDPEPAAEGNGSILGSSVVTGSHLMGDKTHTPCSHTVTTVEKPGSHCSSVDGIPPSMLIIHSPSGEDELGKTSLEPPADQGDLEQCNTDPENSGKAHEVEEISLDEKNRQARQASEFKDSACINPTEGETQDNAVNEGLKHGQNGIDPATQYVSLSARSGEPSSEEDRLDGKHELDAGPGDLGDDCTEEHDLESFCKNETQILIVQPEDDAEGENIDVEEGTQTIYVVAPEDLDGEEVVCLVEDPEAGLLMESEGNEVGDSVVLCDDVIKDEVQDEEADGREDMYVMEGDDSAISGDILDVSDVVEVEVEDCPAKVEPDYSEEMVDSRSSTPTDFLVENILNSTHDSPEKTENVVVERIEYSMPVIKKEILDSGTSKDVFENVNDETSQVPDVLPPVEVSSDKAKIKKKRRKKKGQNLTLEIPPPPVVHFPTLVSPSEGSKTERLELKKKKKRKRNGVTKNNAPNMADFQWAFDGSLCEINKQRLSRLTDMQVQYPVLSRLLKPHLAGAMAAEANEAQSTFEEADCELGQPPYADLPMFDKPATEEASDPPSTDPASTLPPAPLAINPSKLFTHPFREEELPMPFTPEFFVWYEKVGKQWAQQVCGLLPKNKKIKKKKKKLKRPPQSDVEVPAVPPIFVVPQSVATSNFVTVPEGLSTIPGGSHSPAKTVDAIVPRPPPPLQTPEIQGPQDLRTEKKKLHSPSMQLTLPSSDPGVIPLDKISSHSCGDPHLASQPELNVPEPLKEVLRHTPLGPSESRTQISSSFAGIPSQSLAFLPSGDLVSPVQDFTQLSQVSVPLLGISAEKDQGKHPPSVSMTLQQLVNDTVASELDNSAIGKAPPDVHQQSSQLNIDLQSETTSSAVQGLLALNNQPPPIQPYPSPRSLPSISSILPMSSAAAVPSQIVPQIAGPESHPPQQQLQVQISPSGSCPSASHAEFHETEADPASLTDQYIHNWQPTGRYRCCLCSYSCVTKNYLFRHWLVSHNKTLCAYYCPYCDFHGTYKDSVTRHIGRWHKDQKKAVRTDKTVEEQALAQFKSLYGIDIPRERLNTTAAGSIPHVTSEEPYCSLSIPTSPSSVPSTSAATDMPLETPVPPKKRKIVDPVPSIGPDMSQAPTPLAPAGIPLPPWRFPQPGFPMTAPSTINLPPHGMGLNVPAPIPAAIIHPSALSPRLPAVPPSNEAATKGPHMSHTFRFPMMPFRVNPAGTFMYNNPLQAKVPGGQPAADNLPSDAPPSALKEYLISRLHTAPGTNLPKYTEVFKNRQKPCATPPQETVSAGDPSAVDRFKSATAKSSPVSHPSNVVDVNCNKPGLCGDNKMRDLEVSPAAPVSQPAETNKVNSQTECTSAALLQAPSPQPRMPMSSVVTSSSSGIDKQKS